MQRPAKPRISPRWSGNLVLVCDKCGKKLADAAGGTNPAATLKDWLKKELVSRSLWGSSRVVVTSCLDICPEERIAIAFLSDRSDLPAQVEAVDPVLERDYILETVLARTKA